MFNLFRLCRKDEILRLTRWTLIVPVFGNKVKCCFDIVARLNGAKETGDDYFDNNKDGDGDVTVVADNDEHGVQHHGGMRSCSSVLSRNRRYN